MNRRTDRPSEGDPIFDDAKLKDLIRRTESDSAATTTRPSDNALHAYLSGAATQTEIAEVQDALSRSAEFRHEYLEMAESFAELPASLTRVSPPRPKETIFQRAWQALSATALRPAPAFGYLAALVIAAVLLITSRSSPNVVEVSGSTALAGGERSVPLTSGSVVRFTLPIPSVDPDRVFKFEISTAGTTNLSTRIPAGELGRLLKGDSVVLSVQESAIPTGVVTIRYGFEGSPEPEIRKDLTFTRGAR